MTAKEIVNCIVAFIKARKHHDEWAKIFNRKTYTVSDKDLRKELTKILAENYCYSKAEKLTGVIISTGLKYNKFKYDDNHDCYIFTV